MSNINDLVKTIGVDWFASHLINILNDLQRQFAIHHADMNGMMWPNNLLGKMQDAIKERNTAEITELAAQSEAWIEHSKVTQESLHGTLILIKAFLSFYEETRDEVT